MLEDYKQECQIYVIKNNVFNDDERVSHKQKDSNPALHHVPEA